MLFAITRERWDVSEPCQQRWARPVGNRPLVGYGRPEFPHSPPNPFFAQGRQPHSPPSVLPYWLVIATSPDGAPDGSPARLGEARCEISRGGQAKGGVGAVLKRLGGITFTLVGLIWFVLAARASSGLVQTLAEEESRRVEAALGLPSALPLDVAIPRDGAMLQWTLYEGAGRSSGVVRPPRPRTRGTGCGVTRKWTSLRRTELHRDSRSWQVASVYTIGWAGIDDPLWTTWNCLCSTWLCVWRHWCAPMFPCTGATKIVPLETPSQQLANCPSGLPGLATPTLGRVAQGEAWGISMCTRVESAVPARNHAVSSAVCWSAVQRLSLQPPKTFPHTLGLSETD